MTDLINSAAGAKMMQLKQEIIDLKAQLKACDNAAEVASLKKIIMEKETYYYILADKVKMNNKPM
jgi:hypothetical protein